jgi:hypothetical protein
VNEEREDAHEALGVHGYALPSRDIFVFQKVSKKGRILSQQVNHSNRWMNAANFKAILNLAHDGRYVGYISRAGNGEALYDGFV